MGPWARWPAPLAKPEADAAEEGSPGAYMDLWIYIDLHLFFPCVKSKAKIPRIHVSFTNIETYRKHVFFAT